MPIDMTRRGRERARRYRETYAATAAEQGAAESMAIVYGRGGTGTPLGLVDPGDLQTLQVVVPGGSAADIDTSVDADPVLAFDRTGAPVGIIDAADLLPLGEIDSTTDDDSGADLGDQIDGAGATTPTPMPSLQASGKQPCSTCGKPHGPSFHSRPTPESMHAVASYLASLHAEERAQFGETVAKLLRF